jgi:3-deoxy-D-manno-octulosonic-acid transferase
VGKPVLIGPHTYNFTQASNLAVEQGAALRVQDADSLAHTLQKLLLQPDRLAQMGSAGFAFVKTNRGATVEALAKINHAITCT